MERDITIFQAPWICLLDCGLLVEIHLHGKLRASVPAQYYLPVFRGEIEVPEGEGQKADGPNPILERVAQQFGPGGGFCGKLPRPLMEGDVVRLGGQHYLLAPEGFREVRFEIFSGDDLPRPDRREEFCGYLREKYALYGKAGTLLENILDYNEMQGWPPEDELRFLEDMLRGIGINDADREIFSGGDDLSVW